MVFEPEQKDLRVDRNQIDQGEFDTLTADYRNLRESAQLPVNRGGSVRLHDHSPTSNNRVDASPAARIAVSYLVAALNRDSYKLEFEQLLAIIPRTTAEQETLGTLAELNQLFKEQMRSSRADLATELVKYAEKNFGPEEASQITERIDGAKLLEIGALEAASRLAVAENPYMQDGAFSFSNGDETLYDTEVPREIRQRLRPLQQAVENIDIPTPAELLATLPQSIEDALDFGTLTERKIAYGLMTKLSSTDPGRDLLQDLEEQMVLHGSLAERASLTVLIAQSEEFSTKARSIELAKEKYTGPLKPSGDPDEINQYSNMSIPDNIPEKASELIEELAKPEYTEWLLRGDKAVRFASDYEMITETFNTYGLDPLMGLSLVNIESDFNHGALNHTDEEGEVISEWQFTFGTTYALGRDWSRMIEPAYATETAALLHQAVESGNAALGLVGIEKIQEELEPSSPHKLTPSIRAALHAIAHHSTGLQERVLRNYYATGLLTVPEGNPKTENHLQNFMASYAQITGSIEKGDLGKQIRDLRRDNSRLREARPEEGDVDFSQLNEVPKNLSIPDMPDQIAEELKASTLWTEDSREGLIVYFEPISEAFESNSLDPVMGLTLAKTLSEFDSAEVGDAGKWGERRSIWQFTQAEVVAMGADWNQMTDPTYALNFAVQYHRALDYGSTGYENEGLVNIMVDARSDAEQRGTTLYEPTHGTYVALHLLARQSGVHAAERAFREYLNDGTLNLATPIRGDDRGWLEHIVITGVPAYLELNEAVHRLTDTGKN